MVSGIDAVRRTSDSITRQSLKAIEGFSSQADVLRGVSENVAHQISGVTNRFDDHGQSIVSAASALEGATLRIDSTLQKRQQELNETLQRMSGNAQQLDEVMRGMRTQTDAQSQAVVAEFDRLRAHADAQTMRTIEDMRSKMSGASNEMTQHLRQEHERLRAEAERLPIVTRESAETMRTALNDQLRALEQLSSLSARERRDVTPPAPWQPARRCRSPRPTRAGSPVPPPPLHAPPADHGERWSLGDLLARASLDDDGTTRAPLLDIEGIARALDPTTASAIWSRFRAGQRGIMVRSIYTAEGRSSFDDVTERYGRDVDFRRTVDRFLADFERLVRETEQKSPRAVHDHLVSDAGRVYLFLAHASGRLR